MTSIGLLDTSAFIEIEHGGGNIDGLPSDLTTSVIVLGELMLGVLLAGTPAVRARRLSTFGFASLFDAIPADRAVAERWAGLTAQLQEDGRPMGINDSWIAATALAHGMTVVTQDAGFEAVPGLDVALI